MENETLVRSVKKALDMLDLVIEANASGGPAGLMSLAGRLSMPRNTAHNLLKTLVACGYVEQHERGVYIPGSKCRKLVRLSQFDDSTVREALTVRMQRFVDAQGEDCVLAVLVNGERVVINYVGSKQTVRVAQAEVEKDSFFSMPTGRMLAAIAEESELQQILERHGMPGKRWNNINDEATLRKELGVLRRQGYCRIGGEANDALIALACPVGSGDGPAWGAAGVFAPVYRCPVASQKKLLEALRKLSVDLAKAAPALEKLDGFPKGE